MGMIIEAKIPGGNVIVHLVTENEAVLEPDLRDTAEKWFYWKFKVGFDKPGMYSFRFVNGAAIGTRGPAVSADNGLSWEWLGREASQQEETFSFECAEAGLERWFCVCIPYMQPEWERFIAVMPTDSITVSTLCHSRKGRAVECLTIGSPNASKRILVTSRHHAQESMATFSLEGFIREIAEHPESHADTFVFAVPFVDKDGVENGDQGKRRMPHDHGRDYVDEPLYTETRAIKEKIMEHRFNLAIDMHCPWLRGYPYNETMYFVGPSGPGESEITERFSRLLEEESTPDAPHFAADDLPYGVAWNTASNYSEGRPQGAWMREHCDWHPARIGAEIPFANFRDLTIMPENAMNLGRAFARAAARFLALPIAPGRQ